VTQASTSLGPSETVSEARPGRPAPSLIQGLTSLEPWETSGVTLASNNLEWRETAGRHPTMGKAICTLVIVLFAIEMPVSGQNSSSASAIHPDSTPSKEIL